MSYAGRKNNNENPGGEPGMISHTRQPAAINDGIIHIGSPDALRKRKPSFTLAHTNNQANGRTHEYCPEMGNNRQLSIGIK